MLKSRLKQKVLRKFGTDGVYEGGHKRIEENFKN